MRLLSRRLLRSTVVAARDLLSGPRVGLMLPPHLTALLVDRQEASPLLRYPRDFGFRHAALLSLDLFEPGPGPSKDRGAMFVPTARSWRGAPRLARPRLLLLLPPSRDGPSTIITTADLLTSPDLL